MRLEGRTKSIRARGIRHFRQGFVDLFFGVVDVLEGIDEKIIEVSVGHKRLLWSARDRSTGTGEASSCEIGWHLKASLHAQRGLLSLSPDRSGGTGGACRVPSKARSSSSARAISSEEKPGIDRAQHASLD